MLGTKGDCVQEAVAVLLLGPHQMTVWLGVLLSARSWSVMGTTTTGVASAVSLLLPGQEPVVCTRSVHRSWLQEKRLLRGA